MTDGGMISELKDRMAVVLSQLFRRPAGCLQQSTRSSRQKAHSACDAHENGAGSAGSLPLPHREHDTCSDGLAGQQVQSTCMSGFQRAQAAHLL